MFGLRSEMIDRAGPGSSGDVDAEVGADTLIGVPELVSAMAPEWAEVSRVLRQSPQTGLANPPVKIWRFRLRNNANQGSMPAAFACTSHRDQKGSVSLSTALSSGWMRHLSSIERSGCSIAVFAC